MKQYATYLRVSTQKQGRTMLGIEAQRKMCQDFVSQNKGNVKHEFIDIESGTHRDRKGLQDAIMFCKKNNCPLVIAKLDRLARDVEFCFKVINTGIDIHFCDMPTINTLLLGVFASVAQYERELTSDRTRKALAVKKSQGALLGGANPKYRATRKAKTYEQKEIEDMKKGVSRTRRHLESKDVKAFLKVLQRCFPDSAVGEPEEWDWKGFNTKMDNRVRILQLMKDLKDMDYERSLFSGWDFSDITGTPLQVRLASFISNLRRSYATFRRQRELNIV